MKLADARVTVIGIGLMGGSLAKALEGKAASLTGVDHDRDTIEYARAMGIFDHVGASVSEGLAHCDLAILAVPVKGIIDLIKRIGEGLPAPRFLLDLGSTKTAITRHMETLPDRVDPIGGHPLCGTETAGIQASDAAIFQGSIFALNPLERTSRECLHLAEELVRFLGAHPIILGAEEHDRLAAITSHLPYLLTAALTQTAKDMESTDQHLAEMIASGFMDTTRVAASGVEMIGDVLLSNQSNVLRALNRFSENAQTLAGLIEAGNMDALHEHLLPIQRWRALLSKPGIRET